MSNPEVEKDIRALPLPDQVVAIEEAIEDALQGRSVKLFSETHMAATYALPKALGKGVRCRVTPDSAGPGWQIAFSPKNC